MIAIEEIKKFIDGVDNDAFEVFEIGAYRKDGKVELFVTYRGGGMDANVYNETYDEIVYFTDSYKEYQIGEHDIDQLAEMIKSDIEIRLMV